MQRDAPVLSPSFMASRTMQARKQVESAIERAKALEADERRDERIASQRCKACFYFPRMAGQAITAQPCACCAAPQTYSNTDTDVLCLPCASEHALCKHCGGDLDMRAARRSWPTVSAADLAAK